MIQDMDILKFNLQESSFPYFTDSDLEILLSQYPDINQASYEGCLLKASEDAVSIGPIKTSSNRAYWLRMADHYKQLWVSGGASGIKTGGAVILKRSDDL